MLNETFGSKDIDRVGSKQGQTSNVQRESITHSWVSETYLYKPVNACMYGLMRLSKSLTIKMDNGHQQNYYY